MALRDLLLLLDPEDSNAAPLALTAGLARAHDAVVRGLCLYQPPAPTLAEGFAIGARAEAAVIDREARTLAVELAPAQQAFLRALHKGPYPHVWEPHGVPWIDAVVSHALTTDLIVAGVAGFGESRASLLEAIVLRAAAPLLLAPERTAKPHPPRHAVVAWNGSRAAKRALDDALPLLTGAARTDLLVVAGPRDPVLGADLAAVIGRLQRHGVAASLVAVDPAGEPAVEVIRRHCDQARADLLVVGGYSHSATGERMFGGVSRSLLAAPSLPTFVSR